MEDLIFKVTALERPLDKHPGARSTPGIEYAEIRSKTIMGFEGWLERVRRAKDRIE